eukprot:CAMPEP_0197837572 /NCGR_PEP_ID=MMETSP1437-20131217/32551_1 /TAXON_ID=49252 ORGANISM="Eucampia antarctica, Strain CCMP1452" /NCGR_SAMPLE_ID=MMETSP1437 /ASSEMBLY_ACC=CAM_ASM_001096 /LENGTH=44 /DNA_ID= /DNA_START= /DNA_END= /DNA_ORIENTATION=
MTLMEFSMAVSITILDPKISITCFNATTFAIDFVLQYTLIENKV